MNTTGQRVTETLIELRALDYPDPAAHFVEKYVPSTPAEHAQIEREAAVVRIKRDQVDRHAEAFDRMLAGRPRGFRGLYEAYGAITATNRRPTADDLWRALGGRAIDPFAGYAHGRESVQTATFLSLLGDAVNRAVVAEYRTAPGWQAWRAVVSSTRFNTDFRFQRVERIGGYGTLPTVAEGAPFQSLPTPTNDTEDAYKVAKRGGIEDLTLETIANDDVGALRTITTKLGRSAAQTLCRFTFGFLDTNPVVWDGLNLFVAQHANANNLALSESALAALTAKMRKVTAYGDPTDVLGVVPRWLLVGPDLEELALQLCRPTWPSADLGDGALAGTRRVLLPVTVPHWSSPSAWYLVADGATCPSIELGFASSSEDPTITIGSSETTADGQFQADKLAIKVHHTYGGAVLDYRGLVQGGQ